MTSQIEHEASNLQGGQRNASRNDGHLPECTAYRDECGGGCICHHVRACETRVLGDRDEIVGLTAIRSFRAGLDAAREAVAVVGVRKDTSYDMRVQALAAIDALREGQK